MKIVNREPSKHYDDAVFVTVVLDTGDSFTAHMTEEEVEALPDE